MNYFSYNDSIKPIELKRGTDPSWSHQEQLVLSAKIAAGIAEHTAVTDLYGARSANHKESSHCPEKEEGMQ